MSISPVLKSMQQKCVIHYGNKSICKSLQNSKQNDCVLFLRLGLKGIHTTKSNRLSQTWAYQTLSHYFLQDYAFHQNTPLGRKQENKL